MATVPLYNFKDKKKQSITASDEIFGIKPHLDVISQVVQSYFDNQHAGLSHTKSRGEVRGGGRKPWKQKGTGRARQGSIRSPQWVGGGIVFGPRKRIITRSINKKMRRLAIMSMLSARLSEGRLWAFEGFELDEAKTKLGAKALQKMPKYKNLLIVTDQQNSTLHLALRNIPEVNLLESNIPSVMDLLQSDFILIDKDMIKRIEEIYGKDKDVVEVKAPQAKAKKSEEEIDQPVVEAQA
ncbi:MAG: 50S ribosomal protein L4 [bacterium]